jgi:hypothetical protein
MKERMNKEELQLSIEDIDTFESLKDLSIEQKEALISFIYEISVVLYNSYQRRNDPSQNASELDEK